ncbi:zinc-binding alcohol dehydrogenase [Paenibacillus sp. NPDC056579]|uniref:zinc-dependent alcohol dehydrogenase n=1 Tax=unclassified Paenibacillus TaxID=185978 RepID=UPI001EF7DDA0|nr:zinc-binding alcohol dehydrogenase [Paenibacillus sp. H1-7]ULL14055.1 alcohol dehydrogenase [Paenibacillus sp. H1-7]
MKAIVNHRGNVKVADEPLPVLQSRFVLVKSVYSAISPGTELTAIRRMPEQQASLGYSAAGIAVKVGAEVEGIREGQQVACYGGPYVKHAEYLLVPKHLVVPVPDTVSLLDASTAGLGAIAIHALRQADLRFGESVVIIGLGILGQIIARIAHAACLKVIACDLLPERREALAGIEGIRVCSSVDDIAKEAAAATSGLGADCVIHCAAGRQMQLMDESFGWIRDRGKILIVGDMHMEFTRSKMFHKEAQVLISRAGGPGRYDPLYERDGYDYPPGYVRWTEERNLAEYIRLLTERRIDVSRLITDQVAIGDAWKVYEKYKNNPADVLGAVISYSSGS